MRFLYAIIALGLCAIFFMFFMQDASADAKLLSTALVVGGLLAGADKM